MPPLEDQRILVTGGAGFVGSHLVERLVGANEVRVLDNLSSGTREWVDDRATLIEGDIRDADSVAQAARDVDVIFHQAANVCVEQSVSQPLTTHDTNVAGTLTILEHARDGDARVVLASSAAVYGEPAAVPIPEDALQTPTSPYGLEKLTVDHYGRLYAELYGVETVMLRYFNIYGPRQSGGQYSGVIDVFLQQALNNEPLTVHGDGTQTRDFVHVADVVEANCLAAVQGMAGEAYNIGTGRSISVRELAEIVTELTDSDSEIVHQDARGGDIAHSRADIQKATHELEFEPAHSLRDGLDSLVSEEYR
jgi:UDP-glucose 4-epimerase